MRWLSSFRAQAAVIALACLSVAALAFVWIRDVVRNTERTLVEQAREQCFSAAGELRLQYLERGSYGDSLAEMPRPARDVSLGGITGAVLRSYSGVEGGFYDDGPLGSSISVPPELPQVVATAVQSRDGAAADFPVGRDLVVVAVLPIAEGEFAWAAKRLPNILDPAAQQRRWLLAALVMAIVISVTGVISISLHLRRGAASLKRDLSKMEADLSNRPETTGGDFGEIAAAIADMADRRAKLEANLRHQDRLAALGKVVAGVAHEIRNPLNSMRLTLELLERRVRQGTATPAQIAAAIEQVDRLNRIVDRLLSFGRPEWNDRQVQPVTPIIRYAAGMAEEQMRARNVRVKIENSEDDLLECNVDAAQIQQVILNLLLNAIHFSPEGAAVEVRAQRHEDQIEVSVADQGPGIAPVDAPHVFDAFFTTRLDGTGLGLSVSREIVVNHGGELTFATSSQGSTFTMRLPGVRTSIDATSGVA